MYKQFTALLILTCLCHSAWAEKIYKCQDAKGILIYGSSPCKANVETLNTWTVATKVKPPETLTLKQNDFGQYSTEGAINEQTVTFVVIPVHLGFLCLQQWRRSPKLPAKMK